MVEISNGHLKLIKNTLTRYAPGVEARVFGSRVKGHVKSYSDLDVVLVSQQRIAAETLIRLKEAFQESELPFRVDIMDWHRLSEEFRKIINQNYEVLLDTGSPAQDDSRHSHDPDIQFELAGLDDDGNYSLKFRIVPDQNGLRFVRVKWTEDCLEDRYGVITGNIKESDAVSRELEEQRGQFIDDGIKKIKEAIRNGCLAKTIMIKEAGNGTCG